MGSLCAHPRAIRRAKLAEVVVDCEGKLLLVAYELGYHRSHIYRLIDQHRLWPLVNRTRRQRLEREARERRRRH